MVGLNHNINNEGRVDAARLAYNSKLTDVSKHVPTVTDSVEQRELSKSLDSQTWGTLRNGGSEEQRARWTSRAGPYAMAFLHAPPCEANGTALTPLEFRTALQYHCNAEIFTNQTHCPDCSHIMPSSGNHAVECG